MMERRMSTKPGAKVLVAQEEPEMLDVIRVSLEQAGYDALSAADGVEAYEAIEGGNPAAIILDLNLTGLSGFRLVKLIRRNPRWRRIPVIVTTAYSCEEVEDIFSEGIDGFITRPFTPADVMSRLEWAMSRERQLTAV
jgi:two-component system, chemotaxis family, chemotaxis protein CheY